MGKVFGMMRAAPMAEMQLSMFGKQQEKITEEMGKRAIGQSAAKAAGNIIQQRAMGQGALEQAMNVHDTVYKQYGEDHPDVKAGKVKATDFVFPGMAGYGMPENPNTMVWSSRSAAQAAQTKAEIQSREQNAPVGEGATNNDGDNNTPPTPPAAGGAAKVSKKKNNSSPNTTNVEAPKVSQPSVTPPWHRGQ
jgi:hypothetical protein